MDRMIKRGIEGEKERGIRGERERERDLSKEREISFGSREKKRSIVGIHPMVMPIFVEMPRLMLTTPRVVLPGVAESYV